MPIVLLALALLAHAPPLVVTPFEVSPEVCPSACRFKISYTGGKQPMDVMLDWAVAATPVAVMPFAARAYDAETNVPVPKEALVTGTLSTVARVVMLTPARPGVLITQWGVNERAKAAHFLFAPHAGKLERVWGYEERPGSLSTSVAVAPVDAEHEGIWLFESLATSSEHDGKTDELTVKLARWDDKSGTVVESRDTTHAMLAVIERFATLGEAVRTRDVNPCFKGFLVLPSTRLSPEGNKGPFVLAAVAASKPAAGRVLQRVRTCAKGFSGRVSAFKGAP